MSVIGAVSLVSQTMASVLFRATGPVYQMVENTLNFRYFSDELGNSLFRANAKRIVAVILAV